MAKYIDLHNLKENLTNFLNKKIDPIYAKKTEVPQGTVVDDALSSTSTNPVQNKVVKAEFDQLNSNLSDLKVSEVAGGKNLFTLNGKEIHTDNVKHEVINENSVSITGNDNCPSNQWVQIVVKNIKVKKNTDYVLSIGNVSNALSDTMCAVVRTDTSVTVGSMYNVQSNALIKFHVRDYDNVFIILRHSQNDSSGASNHTIIWSNIQLEEGTQATDYEPYIPSVKMLADENSQQSIEAMDLKMLGWSVPKECPVQNYVDSDGVFHQIVGRVDLGSLNWTYDSSNGQFYSDVYSTLPSANEWNKNVYSLKYTMSILTIGLSEESVGIYGGRIYLTDSS